MAEQGLHDHRRGWGHGEPMGQGLQGPIGRVGATVGDAGSGSWARGRDIGGTDRAGVAASEVGPEWLAWGRSIGGTDGIGAVTGEKGQGGGLEAAA